MKHGLILILAFVKTLSAATTPPSLPFEAITWKSTSKEKLVSRLKMGALEIFLEKTTLAEVARSIGVGRIRHQGDAGGSLYWLCYTIPGKDRIWVASHGEMGGENHLVTEISAQVASSTKVALDCPALPENLQSVALDKGIWLKATETELNRAFGQPSHKKGPWRLFDFEAKIPGACAPDGFDLGNWLQIKIEAGKIIEIHAGQVTSC